MAVNGGHGKWRSEENGAAQANWALLALGVMRALSKKHGCFIWQISHSCDGAAAQSYFAQKIETWGRLPLFSVSLALFRSVLRSLALSLAPTLILSLSLSLSPTLILSLAHSLCLSPTHSLSLSLTLLLTLSISPSIILSLSFARSLHLSATLFVSGCIHAYTEKSPG